MSRWTRESGVQGRGSGFRYTFGNISVSLPMALKAPELDESSKRREKLNKKVYGWVLASLSIRVIEVWKMKMQRCNAESCTCSCRRSNQSALPETNWKEPLQGGGSWRRQSAGGVSVRWAVAGECCWKPDGSGHKREWEERRERQQVWTTGFMSFSVNGNRTGWQLKGHVASGEFFQVARYYITNVPTDIEWPSKEKVLI